MKLRLWTSLTIAALVLAGCSGVASPATSVGARQTQPPQPTTTVPNGTPLAQGSQTQPPDVDVCALVSVADVEAISPFTTHIVNASAPGAKEACFYTSAIGADSSAAVTLRVSVYSSPDEALASLHVDEQFRADHGFAAEPIAGVGDVAEGWPGTEDEVSSEAVSGFYVVDTRFNGEWKVGHVPDVDPEAKVQAGGELLKLAISRLP